jgi:hypothetical protein
MVPHQGLVPVHKVLAIRRIRISHPLRVLSPQCVCWYRSDGLTSVTVHFQQHPKDETCYLIIKASSWLFYVGTSLAESQCLSFITCVSVVLIKCLPPVMLTLRTWAVWNRDRRLSIGLPIFFVLCWAPIFKLVDMFVNSIAGKRISIHRDSQLTVHSHALELSRFAWVHGHQGI